MIILLALFTLIVNVISVKTDDIHLCITENSKHFSNLSISNKTLKESTFDCIRSIENEIEMFTIVSPYELFLVNSDDIYVFGEFKSNDNAIDNSQSTVVLTTKQNVVKSTGLKYCHPGGDVTNPPWIKNEFITTILNNTRNDNNIPSNQTLLDYSYFILNSILGPSCLQNIWSDDDNLQELYPKLFELCPHYYGNTSYEQSLRCLIDDHGDIAVTSLEMMHEFEKEIQSKPKELLSFCKNNTLQELSNPCIWRTASWPVLIGNKRYTERIPEIIQSLKYFFPVQNNTSLSDYIKGFGENMSFQPSNNDTNTRKLSWCTLNAEEYKICEFLQQIFSSYDLHIKITSCVNLEKKNDSDILDKYSCIKNMSDGKSNTIYLHSDQLFASKRAKLKVALYADTGLDVLKSILFVNKTHITSSADLKNKKGCFSEFGSIDWLSFVSAYKSNILSNNSCYYDTELIEFLNYSCMPGIRDDFRKTNKKTNVERGCKICQGSPKSSPTAVNCNADQNVNLYASSSGAMDCLKDYESGGQFAVMKINNTCNKTSEDIKVMCKNGTLLDCNEIDDNCYLSITASGGIVTKPELVGDVKLAFLELKKRNLQYRWLPHTYISEVFKNLFNGTFITDLLDIDTCNKNALSNFCKISLELDQMIQNVDTCITTVNKPGVTPRKIPEFTQIITTTTTPIPPQPKKYVNVVAIIISIALIVVFGGAVGAVYWYIKKRQNTNEGNAKPDDTKAMSPEEIPLKTPEN